MANKYVQAIASALQNMRPSVDRVNEEYTGGDGQPWSMKWGGLNLGDQALRAGSYGNPVDPTYFATAFLGGDKEYIPTFEKNINTPIGNLGVETNYEVPNNVDFTYKPSDKARAYIQALSNMLNRR